MTKAIGTFKSVIQRAQLVAKSVRPVSMALNLFRSTTKPVLRPQDMKAILTKAMNRYMNTKLLPIKIKGAFHPTWSSNPTGLLTYEIILTPGSPMVFGYFKNNLCAEEVQERLHLQGCPIILL